MSRPERPYRPSQHARDVAAMISRLSLDEMYWLREKFEEALGRKRDQDPGEEPEGGSGVREPRKPSPETDPAAVALAIPEEEDQ